MVMVSSDIARPLPLTMTPPLADALATGRSSPTMGRKLTAPAEPLGPAINCAAAVELFRDALIVVVSAAVATDTVIGPVWEVTMVLTEPAARNATQVLPFQM
jgi:hypothetical protein